MGTYTWFALERCWSLTKLATFRHQKFISLPGLRGNRSVLHILYPCNIRFWYDPVQVIIITLCYTVIDFRWDSTTNHEPSITTFRYIHSARELAWIEPLLARLRAMPKSEVSPEVWRCDRKSERKVLYRGTVIMWYRGSIHSQYSWISMNWASVSTTPRNAEIRGFTGGLTSRSKIREKGAAPRYLSTVIMWYRGSMPAARRCRRAPRATAKCRKSTRYR